MTYGLEVRCSIQLSYEGLHTHDPLGRIDLCTNSISPLLLKKFLVKLTATESSKGLQVYTSTVKKMGLWCSHVYI